MLHWTTDYRKQLPRLWKSFQNSGSKLGNIKEALASYKQALVTNWNLDADCCARIQKKFVVLLLYGGVEAASPSLAAQTEGSYVPKKNIEEAILLLMMLLRKWHLGRMKWDPSVMEHFTFAMSICGQASVLALLLAAKICSEDRFLPSEGAEYARRAIANAQLVDEHLNSVGLQLLGICLGKQAKVASSNQESSRLQAEALKTLDEAIALDHQSPDLVFDLCLEYAERRN